MQTQIHEIHDLGGFIGISLGSRDFSVAYLREVARNANELFPRFLFLIADTPHAHTFVALKKLSYPEAYERVHAIGLQKVKSVQRALGGLQEQKCDFAIKRWDQVATEAKYEKLASGFRKLFSIDAEFCKDISASFCERARAQELSGPSKSQIDTGCRYILDELAMMVFLSEYSIYQVQIAPRPCPVFLRRYYDGHYKQPSDLLLPKNLKPVRHKIISPVKHLRDVGGKLPA